MRRQKEIDWIVECKGAVERPPNPQALESSIVNATNGKSDVEVLRVMFARAEGQRQFTQYVLIKILEELRGRRK